MVRPISFRPVGATPTPPVKTVSKMGRFGQSIAKAAKVFWKFLKSPGGLAIALFTVGATLVGTAFAPELRGASETHNVMGTNVTLSGQKTRNKVIHMLMIFIGSLLLGAAVAFGTLAGVNKNSWTKVSAS